MYLPEFQNYDISHDYDNWQKADYIYKNKHFLVEKVTDIVENMQRKMHHHQNIHWMMYKTHIADNKQIHNHPKTTGITSCDQLFQS